MGLSNQFVQPVIAVTNLVLARDFYERQLGLSEFREEPGGVRYFCGEASQLFIYESPATAGKVEHTVAGWYVDDLPILMQDLMDTGVSFEHYEEGTPTDENGVFVAETFRAAWVRDPDGNTLAFQENFERGGAAEKKDEHSCPAVHVEVRGADPNLLREFYAGLAGWSYTPESAAVLIVSLVPSST